jgi:cupin fold WbuC family metalloprotein
MKWIDSNLLDSLTQRAKTSQRQRMNYNLHPTPDDIVQRLFNAIEPDTYIRPHRHSDPMSFEIFLIVRGSAALLFFNDEGRILERKVLSAGGETIGVEIPANTWHAMASLEPGTVFFEVKKGPYVQPSGHNVADWAPEEGNPKAAKFVEWYRHAKAGDAPLLN